MSLPGSVASRNSRRFTNFSALSSCTPPHKNILRCSKNLLSNLAPPANFSINLSGSTLGFGVSGSSNLVFILYFVVLTKAKIEYFECEVSEVLITDFEPLAIKLNHLRLVFILAPNYGYGNRGK